MPVAKSAEFEQAVKDVDAFTKKPTNDELLQLYARYKQGTSEKSIDDTAAPGTFDFKAKAKYNAWKDLVQSGVSQEEAQEQYVELAKELKTKYA